MMRGRKAAYLRRPWCNVGLQLFCILVSNPFWASAMSWTCRIDSVPVENIPIQSTTTNAQEQEGGGRLRMLSQNDAMVLPANQTAADPADEDTSTSLFSSSKEGTGISYQEGRECICAILLPTNDKFYCPSPTDHCTVWIRRFHDEYAVSCFEQKSWTVGFARNVWYYLSLVLLVLVLYPFCTTPGRVSVVQICIYPVTLLQFTILSLSHTNLFHFLSTSLISSML